MSDIKSMARSAVQSDRNINMAKQKTMTAKVTSIDVNGRYINTEAYVDSEIRELTVTLPYGISSSAIDTVSVQISLNDNNNGTVVGVIDPNRPVVTPGELILYTSFGQRIEMKADGNIVLHPKDGGIISLADGTNGVARIGDNIQVSVGDHGICTGTIIGGSSKVKCG